VALSGPNAESFVLTQPPVTSISGPPGTSTTPGSTTFTIAPRDDLTSGTYSAIVTVSGISATAGWEDIFPVSFRVVFGDQETVDFRALDAAIAEAETRVITNYTAASWRTLQTALAAAAAVREQTPYPTQETVDEAEETLSAALAAMVVDPFTFGDVNRDTFINAMDVLWIQRYLANHFHGAVDENICLRAADVNGDGVVDIADVLHLQRYLARHPVTLGPGSH